MSVIIKYEQVTTPDIYKDAARGWCLKYVDDGVNATQRQARAIYSYNVEKANGNIRTGNLPVGVRVPGFLTFSQGAYVDYGHVFWIIQNEDGSVQIDDSEVHGGARAPYRSIAELLAWFRAQAPIYLGYSLWIDGTQVAAEYEQIVPDPTPEPAPKPIPEPTPSEIGYVVKAGDTLGQIILDQNWGTPSTLWGDDGDVARIAKANNISDPNMIHPGDVIRKA
jgi:nucleoid-associated protein YgaU